MSKFPVLQKLTHMQQLTPRGFSARSSDQKTSQSCAEARSKCADQFVLVKVVCCDTTSNILNLNLHHILQLQHCLENLNSKVTNLSISLHARKQSTLLIQGSPINSGAQGTMRLSTQLELSKICKSKGLVFAQFSSESDNSSFDR